VGKNIMAYITGDKKTGSTHDLPHFSKKSDSGH